MQEKTKSKVFQQTFLDKIVTYFDPQRGAKRLLGRARINALRSGAGGYQSADRSRAATKRWSQSSGSSDTEVLPALQSLRADSRDLQRNAPLAKGAINTVVTNVVGTGMRLQARPDAEVLRDRAKLTDEQIEKFEKQAERIFKSWARKNNCDASLGQNFYGMQGLVLRSALESGDVFAIRRFIERKNVRYGTCIQLIEADRIDNPNRKADTPELTAGVEKDAYGAPVAYHVLDAHPGNLYYTRAETATRLPAYSEDGQWQVLHVFTRLRPEQTRGVPYLAPVIESLKQLDRYTEAEIMAAVVSAAFTVFVSTESGEGLGSTVTGQANRATNTESDIALGNGAIVDLLPGETVNFANPARPNQAFDPFVMSVLRQVGVALELPFEVLIKHFTASYSAAQAAIVEAWKFFRERRAWIAESFCQPCYEAVIYEAVARGDLYAPGFFSDELTREAYLNADWIGDPRGVIDPMKEVNANILMEDRGYKTAGQITAELTGGDWNQNIRTRIREQEKRREGGLLPQPSTKAAADLPEEDEENTGSDKENEDNDARN